MKSVSPVKHPNASMAIISGYLATAIIYGLSKAGIKVDLPEATSAATLVIGVVLFIGKKIAPPAP